MTREQRPDGIDTGDGTRFEPAGAKMFLHHAAHRIPLGLFDAVQATWNLLEPSATDALTRAHAAGLTVIVKEAVANGRLTDIGDQPALIEAASQRGVGADTLNLEGPTRS